MLSKTLLISLIIILLFWFISFFLNSSKRSLVSYIFSKLFFIIFLNSTYSSGNESPKFAIKTKNEEFKEELFHSAGYDSYITGLCFFYMMYGDKTGQILENNKNKIFLMNSLYKSMDLNKNDDEYILKVDNPNEDIFVFRGVKKANNINFEKIFGKKLWENSVIKTIYDEKYNTIIAFTNLKKESIDQRKTEFKVIYKSNTFNDIFTAFTLEEFRNKYMKN